MDLEKLSKKLEELQNKSKSLHEEIKEISKQAKIETNKRRLKVKDIDKEIYVKELEIKIAKFEDDQSIA